MPTPTAMPADWDALWAEVLQARATPARGAQPSLHRPSAARPTPQPTPPSPETAAPLARGWRPARPCSADSAAWLALYQPLLDARLEPAGAGPWAVAQLGQSLDGCVATATGDSYFVTGAHSLLHLHRLRALCDAVLVGAGTVAADNPQLTTRRVPGPHPVRVVLDPDARLDGSARLMHDGLAPTLWLCDQRHAPAARARLTGASAEVLAVEGLLDAARAGPGPDLAPAFAALAARGLRVLLVEGGGVTVSRCLQAGLLDRLHLVIAPVIIGAGRRGLQHPSPARMADCLRPPARRLALGEDMLWDLALRGPGTDPAAPG